MAEVIYNFKIDPRFNRDSDVKNVRPGDLVRLECFNLDDNWRGPFLVLAVMGSIIIVSDEYGLDDWVIKYEP